MPQFELAEAMRLRDWFAGQCLASGVILDEYQTKGGGIPENIAESSYRIADAMLAERNKVVKEFAKKPKSIKALPEKVKKKVVRKKK